MSVTFIRKPFPVEKYTRENLSAIEDIIKNLIEMTDDALARVGQEKRVSSEYPGYSLIAKIEKLIETYSDVHDVVKLKEQSTPSGYQQYPHRVIDDPGYVCIYTEDYTYWKYEHRYVMEQHLKRSLYSTEIIHHIDSDKTNNVINNLQLTDRRVHGKIHAQMKKGLI